MIAPARGLLAAAVVVAIGLIAVPPAQAEEQKLEDVTLTWGLSEEAGGGAHFGSCNFLSAGIAGDAGTSRLWTAADGFYQSAKGNVTIVKDGPGGSTVGATWATRCQSGTGAPVGTGPGSSTNNRAVFSGGTGTVDLAEGTATVSWEGSFTSAFYGGMTYWSATDPTLTVTSDGRGTLTATLSGYASSMADATSWKPIPARNVTLATLTDVALTPTGLTVTPDYLGRRVEGVTQSTGGPSWGAFPQPFVDFHQLTGQASYWYSSGSAADAKKPAAELAVSWQAHGGQPQPSPQPSVSPSPSPSPSPTTPAEGALSMSVEGEASLGTATVTSDGFVATGDLPAVTVTDDRPGGSWSVAGSVTDFTGEKGVIPASALGWRPLLLAGEADLGAKVEAGAPGLAGSVPLASGGVGTTRLGADLALEAPTGTLPGAYRASLTITVLG